MRTGIAAVAAMAMLSSSGCATVMGTYKDDSPASIGLGVVGDVGIGIGIGYFVANEGDLDPTNYMIGSTIALLVLDAIWYLIAVKDI